MRINSVQKSLQVCCLLLTIFFLFSCKDRNRSSASEDSTSKGTISISGAFALYPMTVTWAEAYRILHPQVRIDISAGGAGKGMADVLSGTVDLGMFSREIMPAEKERGVWWIAVTKDAVLPTICSYNPLLKVLKTQGLTRSQFEKIFILQQLTDWGIATDTNLRKNINVYTRSDACGAAATWALYLGGMQEDLKGIGMFGDPALADAVKNDPLGIGYNNTIYIYNLKTNKKYNGLEVIPIDFNEDGKIDPDEDFYDSMDAVMEAISTGKYPSPPARELYLIAKGKPQNAIVIEFLQWVLTEGQEMVAEAGYVPLDTGRISSELEKLN
jgi:phosphate transport system substrate-binding protein